MKILITGATGFLGSNVLKRLLHQDNNIHILKRRDSMITRISYTMKNIKLYDIEDINYDELFKNNDYDTIFHFATNYGTNGESAIEVFNTNVCFPLRLLETACKYKTPRFINSDTVLKKYTNDYSLTKKQFSEWGKYLSDKYNICFINVCTEYMYGQGDNIDKFLMQLIIKCLNNEKNIPLTKGEQMRNFIYIDDLVNAYEILLNKNLQAGYHEYHLGTNENISIKELANKIKYLTKSKSKLDFGAIPYRKNELMNSECNLDGLQKLGWTPKISLDEGLCRVIDYVKANW